MAPLTGARMGDDIPDPASGFGGGWQGILARAGLSPTGSAGQMDALHWGIRASALIWADVLAQQQPLPRATWRNTTKGMWRRRRLLHPSWPLQLISPRLVQRQHHWHE